MDSFRRARRISFCSKTDLWKFRKSRPSFSRESFVWKISSRIKCGRRPNLSLVSAFVTSANPPVACGSVARKAICSPVSRASHLRSSSPSNFATRRGFPLTLRMTLTSSAPGFYPTAHSGRPYWIRKRTPCTNSLSRPREC